MDENINGELDTSNQEEDVIEDDVEEGEDLLEDIEDTEDVDIEELKKKAELADNYKIRAEKAESKLKKTKTAGERQTPKRNDTASQEATPLSREEAILYAKGMSDKDVDDAQFIADKEGITLAEATETSRFKALKKDRENEARNNKAQNLASRGSKSSRKVSLSDSDLTTDQHKELWKEKMG